MCVCVCVGGCGGCVYGVLEKAFALKQCKWQSIHAGDEPKFKKRKIDIVHVDRLADLHKLVMNAKVTCDRDRSTVSGKFAKVQVAV